MSVPNEKVVVLRHDVDLLPHNSLETAILEHELGLVGSYYFRAVPESWDETSIKKIAALGHEVGYQYECLSTCHGDIHLAIEDFKKHLQALRKLVPVTTICMHGSPRSKYDSKNLWKHFNYKEYGIIGEPYFDIDFSNVLYLTDTGRRWDGFKVSIRDKVEQTPLQKQFSFHSTQDIIDKAQSIRSKENLFSAGGDVKQSLTEVENDSLPNQIMITVHPQRWTNKPLPWLKEFVMQNLKNVVKRFLIR